MPFLHTERHSTGHARAEKLVIPVQGIYPLPVDDILREIDAALERRGISARAASIRAQGAPEMIRDMRRGHVPSVERLRSLCEVLGLEFYVGPPRWRRSEDGGAQPDVPLHALERSARDLVRLTLDAGGNPIPGDLRHMLRAHATREPEVAQEESPAEQVRTFGFIEDISGVRPESYTELLLDDLFGEQKDLLPPGNYYTVVKEGRVLMAHRIDEESAEARPASAGHRARRRSRSAPDRGVDAANWDIVKIVDDSMEPTLPSGGVTMVDSSSTGWDPPSIKVVEVGGNTVLRRVVTDAEGRRILVCDHPDWPNEPWPADARIVGQAKWVGHWLD